MAKDTRRDVLKKASAFSLGAIGISQIGNVSANQNQVALVVDENRYRESGLREVVDDLPIVTARRRNSNVEIIWDVKQVRRTIIEPGEWNETRTVEENINHSRAMRDARREYESTREEMDRALNESTSQAIRSISPATLDYVNIGVDKTLYNCNNYNSGQNTFGTAVAEGKTREGNDRLHAEAFAYAPLGSAAAWGKMGDEFYVTGTGSQPATILADAAYDGQMFALGAATCECKITFRVINVTDNATAAKQTMKSTSGTIGDLSFFNKSHDRHSVFINLEAGKTYRPEIKVYVGSAAAHYSGATVDFGKFEDSGLEYVESNWFEISF